MKNFTKRNQIIFLNVIFMLLWMFGVYDEYRIKGVGMSETGSDGENIITVFSLLIIILISCGMSILFQILNDHPSFFLHRNAFLRKLLKTASIFFACSCIFMGGIFVVGVFRNVSSNFIFEFYNIWLSLLSIYFGYLAYLILSQIRFSRKKKLVSNQILDEEIE